MFLEEIEDRGDGRRALAGNRDGGRRARRSLGFGGNIDHPGELFERGLAAQDVRKPGIPERFHPAPLRCLRDPVRRLTGGNQPLELRRHREDLEDGEPAAVAGHRAVGTAPGVVQWRTRGDPAPQPLGWRFHPHFLAGGAQLAHQALGNDAAQRRGDLVRLHADIDEPGDGVGGVVRVQRREHQVSRERRLHGDLRRFLVTNLADQDDVGILPQNRAQRRGEREAGLLLHLDLDDPLHPVFDRVFDRDDVDAFALDLIDRRVECRRLPRAGRSGDEQDAFVVFEQPLDRFGFTRIEAEAVSPSCAGSVETRRSMGWPLTATRARPSWGRSRSAMSSDDMILTREMRGSPAWRGIFMTCRSTPSMR